MSTYSIISRNAIIGKNVKIGDFVKIYDNVLIEDNVIIEDHCVVGLPITKDLEDKRLIIGKNSIIRSYTILYEGSKFGEGLETGHHVLIRENTIAGKNLRVGSFSDIEGDCLIGDFVRCHSYVHIGKGSRIGNFVWLYSLVTLTNDPLPPSQVEAPVTIEDGVVICVGSVVLPRTIIRKGAFISAGSIVKGEIPPGVVVSGYNSAIVGHVTNLIDLPTMTRHPWMKHYKRGYPKEAEDLINKLYEEIISEIKKQKQNKKG